MGACAVANLACRNGILTYCLGPEAPVDDSVRLFDALTAVVKVELFSINQVHMEEFLEKKQAAEAPDKSAAAKPKKDPEEGVDLGPVERAVKRLMDTLQSYNYKDDLNAGDQHRHPYAGLRENFVVQLQTTVLGPHQKEIFRPAPVWRRGGH